MSATELYATLQKVKIPCAYSHFKTNAPKSPPYMVYLGNGQNNMIADNAIYWRENAYTVEYYFSDKNETNENALEAILIEDGWIFEKTEDVYIESENVFVIYYTVTKGNYKNG